jgi:hypothetical protein
MGTRCHDHAIHCSPRSCSNFTDRQWPISRYSSLADWGPLSFSNYYLMARTCGRSKKITRGLLACTLSQISWAWIKEDGIGKACNTHGREEQCIQSFDRKGWKILEKYIGMMHTGFIWRMVSSALLYRVALVRTDVSEEPGASFIRVTKIGKLGTTQAATSNQRTLRRNTKWDRKLEWNSEMWIPLG